MRVKIRLLKVWKNISTIWAIIAKLNQLKRVKLGTLLFLLPSRFRYFSYSYYSYYSYRRDKVIEKRLQFLRNDHPGNDKLVNRVWPDYILYSINWSLCLLDSWPKLEQKSLNYPINYNENIKNQGKNTHSINPVRARLAYKNMENRSLHPLNVIL